MNCDTIYIEIGHEGANTFLQRNQSFLINLMTIPMYHITKPHDLDLRVSDKPTDEIIMISIIHVET